MARFRLSAIILQKLRWTNKKKEQNRTGYKIKPDSRLNISFNKCRRNKRTQICITAQSCLNSWLSIRWKTKTSAPITQTLPIRFACRLFILAVFGYGIKPTKFINGIRGNKKAKARWAVKHCLYCKYKNISQHFVQRIFGFKCKNRIVCFQ